MKNKNKFFILSLIIACLGTSALFVLYHLLIWYHVAKLGETYNFFSFVHPDALSNLAPFFRDMLDGHWIASDGRTFEYAHSPSLWSFVNPIVAAPLLFLFHNVGYTFLFGTIVAVALTFILFYLLVQQIIEHRVFSLIYTTVFCSATLLFQFLFPVRLNNLKVVIKTIFPLGSYTTDSLLSHYISLSIFPTLPFFAAAFLTIFLSLRTKKWSWTITAGFFSGLLIYMFITNAMYIFAALGIMAALFLLQKNYQSIKQIFWICLVAAVTSSAYWANFLAIRALPWSAEFYRRLGGDFSHHVMWSYWREYAAYLLMAAVVWWWGKRRGKRLEATFIIAFVLAAIAVLNIQVLTGFNPEPTVWYYHQIDYGLALGWLIVFFEIYQYFARRGKKFKYVAAGIYLVLTASLLIRVIQTNVYMAGYLYPHYFIPKNISRSLDWLDKNTPTDAVVVSPSLVTNALVPVFTHNRVVPPITLTSPAPQSEMLDRWFVIYKLFNVTPEYLAQVLVKSNTPIDNFALNYENNLMIWIYDTYFFDMTGDAFFNGRDLKIPDNVKNDIVQTYKKYPSNQNYLLHQYKMDYFYVGPYERRITNMSFDKIKFLEKVYDTDGVAIYRIKQ